MNLLISNRQVIENLQIREDTLSTDTNSILVVDDCCFNIVALTSLLEQFNLQADSCIDGEIAL